METAIGNRIYERFWQQLREAGRDGEWLADELIRLYQEQRLQDERSLIQVYERLARERS
jgi:hypothetical protein